MTSSKTRYIVAGSVLVVCLIALAVRLFITAAPAPPSRPPVPVDLSVVALLDLSDRVSVEKHPNQAARDKKVIGALVGAFENTVRRRLFVTSRDKLRVAVAQQTGSGYDPSEFADSMRIDMRELFKGGRPAFDRARGEMLATVDRLYDAATKTTRYTGANIPLFFRDHLTGYVEQPEPGRAVRNILLIVTDGYIELDAAVRATLHDRGNRTTDMRLKQFRGVPDWERVFDKGDHGLIVDQKDECRGLEVLVLEIALDPSHQDDKDLLFKYWRKWLSEMGCGKTELDLTEDSVNETTAKIARFLGVE